MVESLVLSFLGIVIRVSMAIVPGLLLAGCIEEVDARWQLDHDHVIAARATPPRIMPGEKARLEALVAHAGALTSVESPSLAAAPLAPEDLQGGYLGATPLLQRDGDGWIVIAPPAERLASMRPEMGIDSEAPVPVEVVMTFDSPREGEPFYVKKTVWLGDQAAHPVVPPLSFDGAPVSGDVLAMSRDRDVYVSIAVEPGTRVNWYTSCGTLFQDDVATAFLRLAADEPCDGELAVVMRSDAGGVAWQTWPIRAD